MAHNQGYTMYMNSPAWHAKRLQRLKIDKYQCRRCGGTSDLHVHHASYANFRDEKMTDLVTLCKPCHAFVHRVCKASGRPLSVVTAQLTGTVTTLKMIKPRSRRAPRPYKPRLPRR